MPSPFGNTVDGVLQSDLVWRNQVSGGNSIWHLNDVQFAVNSSTPQLGQDFTNVLAVDDSGWEIKGTGDFNGDKKSDIVWRHRPSGNNVIWYFNETQFVQNPAAPQLGVDFNFFPGLTDSNWDIQAIGDFNSDGRDDIVWRHLGNGQNAVWYLRNNQFVQNPAAPQEGADYAYFAPMPDQSWQIKGSADFNGDNRADLVWRNSVTGENAVWFLNNTQFAVNPAAPQPGQDFAYLPSLSDSNWELSTIGQFNGDDQADLVWRNRVTGENAVWFLNGTQFAVNPGAPQLGQDFAYLPSLPDRNWEIVGSIHRQRRNNQSSNPPGNPSTNPSGNTLQTAIDLGNINQIRSINDSLSSNDTNDYYRFNVAGRQSINVILNNLTANADLEILNASGTAVGDAFGRTGKAYTGTTSEVRSRVLSSGTYYLRVYGSNVNTNYTLSILGLAEASSTNFADRVVEITNFYRTQSGLNALRKDNSLTNAAQGHSQAMATEDFFDHTNPNSGLTDDQRARAAGYSGRVGENIAAGQVTAEHAMEGWMYSSGHRNNILNRSYRDIGVGYYYLPQDLGVEQWRRYWTSKFGIPS